MLRRTRNPNVDWATSSLLVCNQYAFFPLIGEEWHILYFLILNRLLRQDLSIHVDDILSVVLACQIHGYWFQDQLSKQLVVQLCSTTAPLTYNCQGRSVIQVFFSSAIAYSGEQTELSVGTSNYEPKYRNLHRLQKDLRQSCMSENYTTTTFYISHFSTIYCQQLDQLLFTAVFPIWREWGISKSPTYRLTADCSASELHSHFGGGGRICTYDYKLMRLVCYYCITPLY